MKAEKNSVVTIDYVVSGEDGEIIDSSTKGEPLSYLHGNGNLVLGLEREIEGKSAGDALKVTVEPADGYGVYDESLVSEVPIERFEGVDDIQPGMRFEAEAADGAGVFTIREISENSVVVDGNHMLAGRTLRFAVTLVDVREATAEELDHGHVHSGHEHHP